MQSDEWLVGWSDGYDTAWNRAVIWGTIVGIVAFVMGIVLGRTGLL